MPRTALLLLDTQVGVLDLDAAAAIAGEAYLDRLASTAAAVRTHNAEIDTETEVGTKTKATTPIPIIHVVSSFRRGFPDASANNMSTARVASIGGPARPTYLVDGDVSATPHPRLLPSSSSSAPGDTGAHDLIVTKRRVSAFAGTDLEVVLRSVLSSDGGGPVDELVVAGLLTSGAVLSTVRAAADLDYRVVVLEDCCVDRDAEVQGVLMRKVFPRQAVVMTAEEWIAGLAGRA